LEHLGKFTNAYKSSNLAKDFRISQLGFFGSHHEMLLVLRIHEAPPTELFGLPNLDQCQNRDTHTCSADADHEPLIEIHLVPPTIRAWVKLYGFWRNVTRTDCILAMARFGTRFAPTDTRPEAG
jgi:hypothetical protein